MSKKGLVVLLAGILVAASALPLFAADVKLSGEYRVRGFLSDNAADASSTVNDTEAITDHRFRLKTTVTSGMVMGVATVDFLNGLGVTAANDPASLQTTRPGGTGSSRFGTTGFGGSNNTVGVREAYMKATWTDLSLAVGRKGTKLGHGIILDDTADTLAFMGAVGGVTITVANLKLYDPQAARAATLSGAAGTDTDVYLLHVMASLMPENDFSGYLAIVQDRGVTSSGAVAPSITALQGQSATNANVVVFGLTADGKFSPFNYGFELDILGGQRNKATSGKDIKGMDLLLGGGMDLGMGNVGLWVIYGSGQDSTSTSTLNVTSISGNYVVGTILQPTAFPTNGDRDGGSINNLFAIKLTGAMSPMEKLNTDAALIFASCAQKTEVAGTLCRTDTSLGTELDVNAAYALADNLSLSGGLGLLFGGAGWKSINAAAESSTQSRLWTQLAFNFEIMQDGRNLKMKTQPKKETPMSKRALMTVGMWTMVGLFVPLFIGCGGGGGTATDLATVPTSSTSGGGSSSDTAAQIAAAVGTAPTFTFAKPTFSPTSGGAGLVITLTATSGTGTTTSLASVTGVTFAGSGSTFVLAHPSDTTITVKVPQGARNGLLSLTGGTNTAASTSLLSFFTEPTVTGFTPNVVVAGKTSMTIWGTNLCAATSVKINDTNTATFDQTSECSGSTNTQAGNTKISGITVPSSITGPITKVTVDTTNGSASNSASAYVGKSALASTNTRAALLISYQSGALGTSAQGSYTAGAPWGGGNNTVTFTPGDIATDGALLYFSDLANGRLISVNPATGAFLTSQVAAGPAASLPLNYMTVALNAALNSVAVSANQWGTAWGVDYATAAVGSSAKFGLTSFLMIGDGAAGTAGGGNLLSFGVGLLHSNNPSGISAPIAALGSLFQINPPVAAQRLVSHIVWFADSAGRGNGTVLGFGSAVRARLLSISMGGSSSLGGSSSPVVLGSFTIPGPLGLSSVFAIAVNNNATVGGDRVWFITKPEASVTAVDGILFSVGIVGSAASGSATKSATTTLISASIPVLTAGYSGYPGGDTVGTKLSFNSLGSTVVPAGRQLIVLSSTLAQVGLHSLGVLSSVTDSLASFGSGFPLVSVATFDASDNLWYADIGQGLIVRCATSCPTTLTSFEAFSVAQAYGNPGAGRPRSLSVDHLGSIWMDAANALYRLMP